MESLKILIFPNARLCRKAARVSQISDEDRRTLSNMATTMYLNSGVGLAASQVGIDKQFVVIDVGNGLVKMVNPEIVKSEGAQVDEEGCLSVPGIGVRIRRAKCVTVRFLDENEDIIQVRAEGLFARAIQHEIDHLCGILILDHANPLKRVFLKRRVGKAKPLDKTRTI